MTAHLWTLRRMSLSIAGMLQAGETPNLEAALVKDLGNAFAPREKHLAAFANPVLLSLGLQQLSGLMFSSPIKTRLQPASAAFSMGGQEQLLRVMSC